MIPRLEVHGSWLAVLAPEQHDALAFAAARFVESRRFFRRGSPGARASVEDAFVSPDESCALVLLRVGGGASGTTYTVPVRFTPDAPDADVVAVLSVRAAGGVREGLLVDAAGFPGLGAFLLTLARGGDAAGLAGRLRGEALPGALALLEGEPSIVPLRVEQSHSMVRVGEHAVAKLLRALDLGDDTELEVGSFLAGAAVPAPVPALLGWVRHERSAAASTVLLVSEWVDNEGTAFDGFRRELSPLLAAGRGAPAELVSRTTLLARRTAELHRALASSRSDAAFAPEPFDAAHGRALGEDARGLLAKLEEQLSAVAPGDSEAGRARSLLVVSRARVAGCLAGPSAVPGLSRIRCHGDYHLGQVLSAGGDFRIVDLGGEPLRSPAARRGKHCPLRDVASMLRSFDYAVETAARDLHAAGVAPSAEAVARLRGELEAAFLGAYLDATDGAPFVPAERADLDRLLVFYGLEKCLYEISYELAQRPAWLPVPIAALERLTA